MGSLQLRERLDALTVKKAQKPPDAALDPKVWSWLKDWKIKKLEWGVPKIGVPQNGWFILGNPIKVDLGVPLFLETPK